MTDSDLNLLTAFEDGTFPLDRWDQRAHVSVAFILLRLHGFEEALDRLRRGILNYNHTNRIKDSPTSGYNETTTVAMLKIVDTVMRAYREYLPAANAGEFCDLHPELMNKHLLRFFYSPGRRMDPRAKTQFLPPDLSDLPSLERDRCGQD
ncbi:MAG: hypothetical protein KDN18_16090 [Verrucomicrobiae bacterium]|nr:hypothetical protein [Verrucomicrobiae bacterium]